MDTPYDKQEAAIVALVDFWSDVLATPDAPPELRLHIDTLVRDSFRDAHRIGERAFALLAKTLEQEVGQAEDPHMMAGLAAGVDLAAKCCASLAKRVKQ